MRRRRQDYQAKRLFEEALTAWDDSWRWILLMTPRPAGAWQRLEHSNQLEVYDAVACSWFSALAERGRLATARLERYDELPAGGLADWFDIKPQPADRSAQAAGGGPADRAEAGLTNAPTRRPRPAAPRASAAAPRAPRTAARGRSAR